MHKPTVKIAGQVRGKSQPIAKDMRAKIAAAADAEIARVMRGEIPDRGVILALAMLCEVA